MITAADYFSVCRLCEGCEARDDILLAALGADLPGKAVMLQASGSFFAYEPILKALQSSHNMPLAHYVAAATLKPEPADADSVHTQSSSGSLLLRDLFSQGSRVFGKKPQTGVALHCRLLKVTDMSQCWDLRCSNAVLTFPTQQSTCFTHCAVTWSLHVLTNVFSDVVC